MKSLLFSAFTPFILGLALHITPVLSAAPLAEKASEDFNYLYQPTQLPDASTPAWIPYQGGSGNSATLSGGVLHIESPGAPSYFYYAMGNAHWRNIMDTAVGMTLEIRIRVAPGTTGGLTLSLDEGTVYGAGYGVVRLDEDGTHWDTTTGFEKVHAATNTDGYHTFRLVKLGSTSTEGGRFNLYRDGELILENYVGSHSTSTPANRLFFGNTGSWLSTLDVEYVRWDTTGAFAPVSVPEPGSAALLGLSILCGTAFYTLRRKL